MSVDNLRSIEARPPISLERMRGGRPVLTAAPAHSWESRVVLNPAAVLVESGPAMEVLLEKWELPENRRARLREAGGAVVMLYRAQGDPEPSKDFSPSYLGLAVLTPQLELVNRRAEPVIEPRETFHDFGVEDPRCTLVGNTYYLHYTGYSGVHQTERGVAGVTQICLATTKDFLDWDLRGPVTGDLNAVSNKNAALFPVPVHGKWLMLHRPMAGPGAMTIHLAEADHPDGPWATRGPFMESYRYAEFARSWIGAGGPPLSLGGDRFLVIYHQGHFTREETREYDLAAALVDFNQADPVISRIEPLMRPSRALEQRGDPRLGVDNVLFTCANYRLGEQLIVPYAGADSRIFGATVPFDRLVAALEPDSSEPDDDDRE